MRQFSATEAKQRLAELLLFLPLHRNLDQRNDSESQNRHHGNRDHQFDERETGRKARRGDREMGRRGEKSRASERLLITPSPRPRVPVSLLDCHYCFTVNLIGSIWRVT